MNPERTERQQLYDQFIESEDWRRIRGMARKELGRKCAVCGVGKAHMHHVFYPKEWKDTLTRHLIPLCEEHHNAAHRLSGGGVVFRDRKLERFKKRLVARLGGIKPPKPKKEKRPNKKSRAYLEGNHNRKLLESLRQRQDAFKSRLVLERNGRSSCRKRKKNRGMIIKDPSMLNVEGLIQRIMATPGPKARRNFLKKKTIPALNRLLEERLRSSSPETTSNFSP